MEESLAVRQNAPIANMPKENKEVNSVVVHEKKSTVANLWKKAVKTGVKVEQTKLKATPLVLKIISIFQPELAPILLPISSFLKSKSGKKLIEIGSNNQDALGDFLTGDRNVAKEKWKESFKALDSEEGSEMIKDTKDIIVGTKGRMK